MTHLFSQTENKQTNKNSFSFTIHKEKIALGSLLLKFPWASVTKLLRHLLILTGTEGFQCSGLLYFSFVLSEISPPSQRLIWSLLEVNVTSKCVYVYSRDANLGLGGNIISWWVLDRGNYIEWVLCFRKTIGLPCWYEGGAKNAFRCDV